jgi:hypothetical protein
VPLWTNRYNGPGNGDDEAYLVALDAIGNVVVAGASRGSGGNYDYTTIKYSSAGVPQWTNCYNGPANGSDSPDALAVDGSGNVVVTGSSRGVGSDSDYATIKYSSDGVPLWTNRYNGPGNYVDEALAIAADASGNVVVTGVSVDTVNNADWATIKYSSAGVPMWTQRYNGPANGADLPATTSTLAVDASDKVIVTGRSDSSASDDGWASIAYSSAGVPLWTNRYDGTANLLDLAR